MTIAVVNNLPVDLVLGSDLPVLLDLLQGAECDAGGNMADVCGNVSDVCGNVPCYNQASS